jgi:adenylylsulfate kinase
MKILICGLPGSGKTTLAKKLMVKLRYFSFSAEWYNADIVRKHYQDWDFSNEGRLRQADRMKKLAEQSLYDFVICDFVAPTEEIRTLFNADFTVWVNTITNGRYEDTNQIFVNPSKFDIEVTSQDADYWVNKIIEKLEN